MSVDSKQSAGKICAVVVTYNRRELLGECLTALLNQTRPLDEIIVVDNASTDGTDQFLMDTFPNITHIRFAENIGAAGGFHEGMKLAYEKGYHWIWVMDDDAIPLPDALQELLNIGVPKEQEIYALANAVLDIEGNIVTFTKRLFNAKTLREPPIDLREYVNPYFETDSASFAGLLVKRKAIDKVGLPFKDFFIFYDDTEYTIRMSKLGKILTIPSSKIIHKAGGSAGGRKFLAWRSYYLTRNRTYMYKIYAKSKVAFYLRILAITLREVARILLIRDSKIPRLKILFKATVHGLRSNLGKTMVPNA